MERQHHPSGRWEPLLDDCQLGDPFEPEIPEVLPLFSPRQHRALRPVVFDRERPDRTVCLPFLSACIADRQLQFVDQGVPKRMCIETMRHGMGLRCARFSLWTEDNHLAV